MIRVHLVAVLGLGVLLSAGPTLAQTPRPDVSTAAVAPAAGPVTDWPALRRYQAANTTLPAAAAGETRVVLMGDSITQNWARQRPTFFADNHYVGRGISGQTSSQMVLRFHQDVIALKPAAVLILAGTNDVAENTGPMTDDQIIANLEAMTEMARAHDIRVVIGSITPSTDFYWHTGMTPAPRIRDLNVKIKAWAASERLVYADFWSAMALPDGTMNPAYSTDSTHPIDAGYGVMEPIAQAAINQALANGR